MALYAKKRVLKYLRHAGISYIVDMDLDDDTGWVTFPWEKHE